MRQYTNIAVSHAVVHVVAPKRNVLRQSTAPIDLDDDVRNFLVGHVTKGLGDSQALAGRFKVVGAERTEGVCRSIVASGRDFVTRSARLAKFLYDASSKQAGTDARVSDGTLVVARCSATGHDGTTPSFVALLKLDPNDAFRAEEVTDAHGRTVVRLVQQHDILPTPRERLQKAAFVRGRGHEYDALAVDHQRRGEVVSEFFLDGFLGLEHVFDAKERTTRLYKTLHRTFNDVKDELTESQYARVDQYIQGQVVGGRVSIDAILDNLPAPANVRKRFEDALAAELPDREFDTDAATAEQLLKRRRFRGDNGLTVTAPAEFFGDMLTVRPPTDPGGQFTITIRTREWTER